MITTKGKNNIEKELLNKNIEIMVSFAR